MNKLGIPLDDIYFYFIFLLVFPNLEFMDIDFNQAWKWLFNNTAKYQMHRLKVLKLSTDHLLKESSAPRLGTVLQLKELVLSISRIKDLGFEEDPILQRLELLSLNSCYDLIKLLNKISMSFSSFPSLVTISFMQSQ